MEQVEHALLCTFLEASSDCKFKEELHTLRSLSLVSPKRQGTSDLRFVPQGGFDQRMVNQGHSVRKIVLRVPSYDDESELQCDGNRSGHLQNGDLEAGALVDEEVIRIIASHLAEIGDKLDKDVQTRAVNDLVQYFLNKNLSREEIMQHMSRVVRELAQAIPTDMEQEKVMLVLTMVLTKKIVNTVPSLLYHAISTTANFMSQQFHNYIVEMLGE